MSGEIEFLDLEPAPDGPATEARSPRRAAAWSAWAVLGWTAGAVLAVVASWQMIYRIAFGADDTWYGTDGWGRQHVHDPEVVSSTGHSGRFGIVLCCGAALLIAAAAWAAVERAGTTRGRRPAFGRVAPLLGLAGTMLFAGTTATVYLDVHATAENLALQGGGPGVSPPVLTYGPFLWCCLAAVVCGLAGTFARLLAVPQSAANRTDRHLAG